MKQIYFLLVFLVVCSLSKGEMQQINVRFTHLKLANAYNSNVQYITHISIAQQEVTFPDLINFPPNAGEHVIQSNLLTVEANNKSIIPIYVNPTDNIGKGIDAFDTEINLINHPPLQTREYSMGNKDGDTLYFTLEWEIQNFKPYILINNGENNFCQGDIIDMSFKNSLETYDPDYPDIVYLDSLKVGNIPVTLDWYSYLSGHSTLISTTTQYSLLYPSPANYTNEKMSIKFYCELCMHFKSVNGHDTIYKISTNYNNPIIIPLYLLSKPPENINYSITNPRCNGQDGSITIKSIDNKTIGYLVNIPGIAASTQLPFTYSALSPDSNYNLEYKYDIQGNSCSSFLHFRLYEPLQLEPHLSVKERICNNIGKDTLVLSCTGGTKPYNFLWGNSVVPKNGLFGDNRMKFPVDPGMYSVTINDNNYCGPITLSVNAQQPNPIKFDLTKTDVSCNGRNDGEISIYNISGGNASAYYQYYKVSGSSSFIGFSGVAPNLLSGNYDVKVMDFNGCSLQKNILLTQPSPLQINSVKGFDATCSNSYNGKILISATGGTKPYTFMYHFDLMPSGVFGYSQTDSLYTNLPPFTYIIKVEDFKHCSAYSTETVIHAPSEIKATSKRYQNKCYGESKGAIKIVTQGGIAPYVYNWNNGLKGDSISKLPAGKYSVTITDHNGCTFSLNDITIDQPSYPLNIDLLPSLYNSEYNISCFGGKDGKIVGINASGGTGAYSYNWFSDKGYISSLKDIEKLYAGNYTLQMSDQNGCLLIKSIELNEPDSIEIHLKSKVFGIYNISCYGKNDGEIYSNVVGGANTGYHYNWEGGTIIDPGKKDQSGLVAGQYSLIVNDSLHCSSKAKIILSQPDSMGVKAQAPLLNDDSHLKCYGDKNAKINLTIAGKDSLTYQYVWIKDGVLFKQGTKVLDSVGAGTYIIRISNHDGNCSSSDTINLRQPTPVAIDSISLVPITGCYGDSTGEIAVWASGGLGNYDYTIDAGKNYTKANAFHDLLGGEEHKYIIFTKDKASCASPMYESLLLQPQKISIRDLSLENILCYGDSSGMIGAYVEGGTGGLSFSIDLGKNFIEQSEFRNLPAGDYHFTAKDGNNCKIDTTVTLLQPDFPLIFSIERKNVSCKNQMNGELKTTASGGTEPYEFQIFCENQLISDDTIIKNLNTGTYHILILDHATCSKDTTVVISEPSSIFKFSDNAIRKSSYNGGFNLAHCKSDSGWFTINVTGGDSPYQYGCIGPYNNSENENGEFRNLRAGAYRILVRDSNACEIDTLVTMTSSNDIFIQSSQIDSSECMKNLGSIQVIPGGGVPPYMQNWYRNESMIAKDVGTIHDISSGLYLMEVIDANGCVFYDTLMVPDKGGLLASQIKIGTKDVRCNGFNDGLAILNIDSSANYKIHWYPDTRQSGLSAINLKPNENYYVEMIDSNNCLTYAHFAIHEPPVFKLLVVSKEDASCEGRNDGAFALQSQGGRYPYSYILKGDTVSTTVFDSLLAGSYIIQSMDSSECESSVEVVLTEPSHLSTSIVHQQSPTCASYSNGNIGLSISGGTAPYNYLLDRGAGGYYTGDITGLPAGIHEIEVRDAKGCDTVVEITLTEPSRLEAKILEVTDSRCKEASGAALAGAAGGTAPYFFLWDDSLQQNTPRATELSAGIYMLRVHDAMGCVDSCTAVVSSFKGPLVSFNNIIPPKCYNSNDGSAGISINGGKPPYLISWNDSIADADSMQLHLKRGLCRVGVIDINGCRGYSETWLTAPPLLNIIVDSTKPPTCKGTKDGFIAIALHGGTGQLKTRFNGNSTEDRLFTRLSAGTYLLEVTDTDHCATSLQIVLPEPEVLRTTLEKKYVLCHGELLELDAGSTSGTFAWYRNDTLAGNTREVSLSGEGTYVLQITDTRGCVSRDSFTLSYSNSLLETNFLLRSEALVGDTMVAVEVTWPIPSQVEWEIPGGLRELSRNMDYLYLLADKAGLWTLGLRTALGSCSGYKEKLVRVNEADTSPEKTDSIDLRKMLQVKIFPNPNRGVFTAQIETDGMQEIEVCLYNSMGIRQGSISKATGTGFYLLPFSYGNLPTGLYLLGVKAGKESKQVRIMIE
jgi:hypothetical protein